MKRMEKVVIDGETLTIEDVVAVARNDIRVEIQQESREKVKKCRAALEDVVRNRVVVYGVTTGVGALGRIAIPPEDMKKLQSNVIRSHSAGVGKPVAMDVTRALMLLRANTLAKGHSGIKLETLETLVQMMNKGVHPMIPEKGSVGASGDLAPLSHMTLVIMGEGQATYKGKAMSGRRAMERAGIRPVDLDFKEGLALNNGTQLMTAIGTLTTYDTEELIKTAEIAASMSLEALTGVSDAYDERIHRVRPHPGQATVAENIRSLTAGSQLIQSSEHLMQTSGQHRTRPPQDPYSLRCTPQVLGAVRDVVTYVRGVLETEINSATDNPLVFPDDRHCLSCGNFHGQPISVAMDMLGIALTVIGNISERRIARLIDEHLSMGLPPFLIHKGSEEGTHSGLMLAQVTAAALASENKSLAHPASVDSIPTSANFEDFVSMGSIAARKAMEILRNVQYIVAIELLCATQGIDFRDPDKLGRGTKAAYTVIRKTVPILKEDRVISTDIEKIAALIRSGKLVKSVEKAWVFPQRV
jgi:histidine ammonia-lyase